MSGSLLAFGAESIDGPHIIPPSRCHHPECIPVHRDRLNFFVPKAREAFPFLVFPHMTNRRFVLWDLDGTLADTAHDLVLSANETLLELGFPAREPDVIRSCIGGGAKKLVDRLLGEDQPVELRERALEVFRRQYAEHLCVRTKPFPGIASITGRLVGRQAVATNKPGALARSLVDQLGWGETFRAVVGGDDVERPKPAPDVLMEALRRSGESPENAILVGDSEFDAGAARACGIPYVHVRWGYARTDCESLATVCVSTGEELARVLGVA